jgi:sigma-B regulation protein RsbU (phosphoserine phosphatase)
VMMVLDPRTHELTVANAGHMPPILRNGSQQVSEIGADSSGMPLGILADQQFKQYHMQLEPEDSLVLFTDGISEGMNHANQIYGTERLASYVATGPPNMKSLVTGIVDDVEKFCDGRPQRDDMCLVALQRTE